MNLKQILIEAAEFVDECPTDAGVMSAVELVSRSNAAAVAGPFLADPNNASEGVSHNETVIGLLLAAATIEE